MAEAARLERWGVGLMAAATLALLAAWPGWRLADAPPADAYSQPSDAFARTAESYASAHRVGERDGVPVVRPPPGGDVPVIARRFEFWPVLELKAGQRYRLHVASVDTVHTLVVAGREVSLLPGQVRVVEVAPSAPGPLALQCGEYCGLGHNRMRGTAEVVE